VRNELVHSKPASPMDVSIRFLQSYMESLMAIKSNVHADPGKGKAYVSLDRVTRPAREYAVVPRWARSLLGWAKLNTDGSFVTSDDAGAGMILRNSSGGIILSACRALFSCRDALEAELCACMEGLSSSIQRTKQPITIEMDSSAAVSMITCDGIDRSVYASLVNEIRYLLSLRQTCITHISRSQNKASDSLAVEFITGP
jgi:ribonuclease HI